MEERDCEQEEFIDTDDPLILCARSKSSLVTEEDKNLFVSRLVVTDEEKESAQNIQQRTGDWHGYRAKSVPGIKYPIKRLTSSNFGAAAGHNIKKTKLELLADMLWDLFKGNEATEYGTIMESTSFRIVEAITINRLEAEGYDQVWIEETGITLSKEHPWLAGSGDGIIYAVKDGQIKKGNLELKCPWKKEFYPFTPDAHYDQFQGVAWLQNSEFIIYANYTPTSSQIDYYKPSKEHWDELFPLLKNFYWNDYLPKAILKERGLLKHGNIDIAPMCTFDLAVVPPGSKRKKTKSEEDQSESSNRKANPKDIVKSVLAKNLVILNPVKKQRQK